MGRGKMTCSCIVLLVSFPQPPIFLMWHLPFTVCSFFPPSLLTPACPPTSISWSGTDKICNGERAKSEVLIQCCFFVPLEKAVWPYCQPLITPLACHPHPSSHYTSYLWELSPKIARGRKRQIVFVWNFILTLYMWFTDNLTFLQNPGVFFSFHRIFMNSQHIHVYQVFKTKYFRPNF